MKGYTAKVGLVQPLGPWVTAAVFAKFAKPGEEYTDGRARSRVARRYAIDRYGFLIRQWWVW